MKFSTGQAAASAWIFFALVGLAFAGNSEFRTWTDSTGTHSVEASFAGCLNGNVKLRKVNGIEVSLPLDKLSLYDRNFIQNHLRTSRLAVRRSLPRVAATANVDPIAEPLGDPRRVARAAGAPQALRANGKIGKNGATQLFGINWYASPDVTGPGQKEKPVMWFRVLGDLAGFM
ncbi:MAG: hypothetical protein IH991_25875 [Planctomycetes bacterium]|nr:hypothetical protein [Planctomycetota bacterium]